MPAANTIRPPDHLIGPEGWPPPEPMHSGWVLSLLDGVLSLAAKLDPAEFRASAPTWRRECRRIVRRGSGTYADWFRGLHAKIDAAPTADVPSRRVPRKRWPRMKPRLDPFEKWQAIMREARLAVITLERREHVVEPGEAWPAADRAEALALCVRVVEAMQGYREAAAEIVAGGKASG